MSIERRTVLTNSFPISRLPTKTFWHYDVSIDRKISDPGKKTEPGPRRSHEIIDRLQNQDPIFQPRAVFDGKHNLFATRQLMPGGRTFEVDMADNPARRNGKGVFLVRMNPVGTIQPSVLNALITGGNNDTTSQMAVNVLQLLVRQAPSMIYPHNSRSVFTNNETVDISGGLEIWRGYFQSVRPTKGRMVINIDISTAVMYRSGNLVDVAMQFLRTRNARDLSQSSLRGDWLKLQNFLKGVKVTFKTDRNRRQAIKSIVDRAGYQMFQKSENEPEISVEQHYLDAHNERLSLPGVFGIKTRSGAIYPAEMCFVIEGQFYKKTISPDQTRAVLKFAVKKPHDRLASIRGAQQVLKYHASDFISEAGMQIQFQPIQVTGDILAVPTLEYGLGVNERPKAGAWNVLNKKFNQPGTIEAWTVIVFDHRAQSALVRKFVETLIGCCTELGIVVPPGMPNVRIADGSSPVSKILHDEERNAAKRATVERASIIICILPVAGAEIRKEVKHWGDVVQGIPTQCIRGDNLVKANDQYCNNVALKINVKLGGINYVTRGPLMNWFNSKVTMVVGADVGHPGPGVMRPSITGLVASVDQNANRYVAFSSVQAPRTEVIADLYQMMASALDMFGQYWKGKIVPQQICFYRDGVSEGEFDEVAAKEVKQIKEAIDYVWKLRNVPAPKPTLTFVVVGKRHHVRFFPLNSGEGDRSGNCPAGFAVNHSIVQPNGLEFYLQSHGGILGTSRPGHYTVLHDENRFTAETLQQFSYALCHTYARATRSVSIPAPVYYADLVCSRANYHFKDLDFSDTSTVATTNNPSFTDAQLGEWKAAFKPAHPNQMRNMYWM